MNFIASSAAVTATVIGVVALLALGFGVYWMFNKQARLRDIAELRKKLNEMRPTDPEYGTVRALYTSMVIDAQRWGFFHSDAASGERNGGAHSGSEDAGHHSGGGGDSH